VVVERHIYRLEGSHYKAAEAWNQECEAAHADLFARVRKDVRQLVEWIDQRFEATLYEDDYSPFCLIANSNESATAIQGFLEAYCQKVEGLTVVRNDIYARFSHVGYNKGTALKEIARDLEITTDRVFAAGDHLLKS
jgi:hydroxymethylpyrimidine pyrophosphatase-like HAD family hydrolase